MAGRLSGKVAFITGAAGGIGQATAARFVDEGARVLLFDREEAPIAELARTLGEERVAFRVGDVTREGDVAAAIADAVARFGGLDVVFANAGIEGRVAPLAQLTVDDFDRVLAVNVRGAFLCIKHAVPALQKRGGGSVIITSSVAGLVGSPGLAAYVTSKHATMGLCKTAAIELAPINVRVNTINPGPIDNRMMRSIEDQAAPGAGTMVKEKFTQMVPLRRYGRNEEIAQLALFLASDESSYSTGASFLSDGGFVAL